MKRTSRPWAFGLSLAIALLGVAGCGDKAGSPANGSSAPASAAAAADAVTSDLNDLVEGQKPWSGDLDGMIERGYIRMLTVHSKTVYFIDKGVPRGTAVDYARLFEDDLNTKLKAEKKLKNKNLKLRVVFLPVQRDQLLPALVAGKGDIVAAGLTITPERQKLVDFSAAGMSDVNEIVVSGPASPAIASVDDLAGKSVFVRKSSSYYENLTALNRRFAAEKKAPVTLTEAPETLEDEDLLEMLNGGLVSLVVVNQFTAEFWKQIFPALTVHPDVAVHTGGEIAWAIRKGTPQLKAMLDDFARRNKVGTSTGNQLLTRYLKNVTYVKNAASESERKKFLALIQYFKKYGDQYDVDWLLMGAQGYQESQLNQNAKSAVGAIGVMQVMPATGKELNVGDITQTEANIHAGIKYMRFMMDRYYESEPMTKLDKALFAFASYNAGPARVRQLRAEAGKRGLDPNVWFQNVEYVAADKIGQETVTYVSNIYKYYIAYKLVMESQAAKQQAVEKLKGATP
ncbi:MAG TPA: transporter substrate-binding domain-containing protein [Steroidobacteraceae bacterium]|nr:transporter substrate-binding domain-containing protein [Steroidobacteraceae bacterium]